MVRAVPCSLYLYIGGAGVTDDRSVRFIFRLLFGRSVLLSIMPTCGALGDAKPADQEVQAIVDEIKEELEKRSGQNFSTFIAVEYKTQLVAGTIFYIKVHAGDQDYVHVRIYKMLPHAQEKLSLTAFQLGKTREDDICAF